MDFKSCRTRLHKVEDGLRIYHFEAFTGRTLVVGIHHNIGDFSTVIGGARSGFAPTGDPWIANSLHHATLADEHNAVARHVGGAGAGRAGTRQHDGKNQGTHRDGRNNDATATAATMMPPRVSSLLRLLRRFCISRNSRAFSRAASRRSFRVGRAEDPAELINNSSRGGENHPNLPPAHPKRLKGSSVSLSVR